MMWTGIDVPSTTAGVDVLVSSGIDVLVLVAGGVDVFPNTGVNLPPTAAIIVVLVLVAGGVDVLPTWAGVGVFSRP